MKFIEGLGDPEGPVVLDDGSFLLVEMAGMYYSYQ